MAPITTYRPFHYPPFNPCSVNISYPLCHLPTPFLPRDYSSNATQASEDYTRANLNAVLYYLAGLAIYLSIMTFIGFVIVPRFCCGRRRAQPHPQHQRVWPVAPVNARVNFAGNEVELQPISGPITVERVVEVQAPKLAALRGQGRRDVGGDEEGEREGEEALPVYVEGERSGSESEAASSYTEVEDWDPVTEAW